MKIPFRRNIVADEGATWQIWDSFGDDVGWLCGREVVLASACQNRGVVRVRFADHRDYCGDCDNKPSTHFKYKIRALVRKHR